jgi:hypothetical protein
MNSPLFIFFFQGQDLEEITGLAQIQEVPDTLAATGIVTPGAAPGEVFEAPDTLAAAGQVEVEGVGDIVEEPDTTVEFAIVPVIGDPAGDDYRGRRRLRRRGLRPDPFERYTDEPDQLPLVARELAGYPPAMPMRAPHPRDLPGGVSPMQATATEMMARMLGTPASTPAPRPQRIGFGPKLAIKGPPMAPVQESPQAVVKRMLRG